MECCVYCYRKYQPGVDHLKVCEKYRLRVADMKIAKLRNAMHALFGAPQYPQELLLIRRAVLAFPKHAHKDAVIKAIDTFIETGRN